jgi:hypothetical protein
MDGSTTQSLAGCSSCYAQQAAAAAAAACSMLRSGGYICRPKMKGHRCSALLCRTVTARKPQSRAEQSRAEQRVVEACLP